MGDLQKTNSSTIKPRILIVDDDVKATEYMVVLLSQSPYEVVACNTGADALVRISEEPFDLVLLDILMPELDGLTVAKRMKEVFGPNNFVPIILLSGLSGQDAKIAGLTHADDFITKPFHEDELLARVCVMLRIRQLQHDLIVSKSSYQFLYENAPYMYVTLDPARRIVDCNALFCHTTQILRNQALGANILSFFNPHDKLGLERFLDYVALESAPVPPQMFILNAQGAYGPVHTQCNAVITENGIMVAMQDITQNVTLENEQKLARKQMYRSARLASIGTFASGVAHELNNPLTAILGFSSALLERIKRSEPIDHQDLEQYLTIINHETVRCSDIVENLSRFAREGDVQIREFALFECVDGAVRLINSLAAKKRVKVSTAIATTVLVKADPQKLQQAIIHILTNSLDFCEKGNDIAIEAFIDTRFIKLSITDNGPGIGSEDLAKVFDPFFTTKQVGKGLGLGLAMCHVIMEECNGGIDIISEKGKGTTVFLDIPAA